MASIEDRVCGHPIRIDAPDAAVSAGPDNHFSRLSVPLQFHALALHLRGQHVLGICDDIRRRRGISIAPAVLEMELCRAAEAARAWCRRPLPSRIAILILEQLPERFRGRNTDSVWTAMGIAHDGMRSILGFWPERPGTGFWLDLPRELKNRGLRQITIIAPNRGIAHLPAIARTFPQASIVLTPLQALAPMLDGLPDATRLSLTRMLERGALAEMPPPASSILRIADRHAAAPIGLNDSALAALQSFLDLPPKLRAFLLRSRVMTVIREKLQRNATGLPMVGDGQTRALLLASRLREIDNGWKVGAGRWRAIHGELTAQVRRRGGSGHQRFDAEAVGHADQLHQR